MVAEKVVLDDAESVPARNSLQKGRRWVVKIGSALLTNDGRGLAVEAMAPWVDQLVRLSNEGVEIVMVSSGSVAEGMSRLGWLSRPHHLHELQAAAAIGQMGLVQAWEAQFKQHGRHTAQILLTHDDLSDRRRYLNARSTLRTLLDLGVVPIINENDTVVTDEIRFGDNDTLAALVANLVEADTLIILTDQSGLYTADPRKHSEARLVSLARANNPELDAMASGSAGALGRGGMYTKLRAARLAARSGAASVIVGGRQEEVLWRLRQGEELGTLLLPDQARVDARKQWLAGHLKTKGQLVLDEGAVRVLTQQGRSLLPVGVKAASGRFHRGEIVSCVDERGREVARGLVNYDVEEALRIIGQPSSAVESILGYVNEPEMIHRDNMVLL